MPKAVLLPVVQIEFQDHSADLEGQSGPYEILAVGVLVKVTARGYYLAHWIYTHPEQEVDVSTYVAKVKGLKIRTLGHVKLFPK